MLRILTSTVICTFLPTVKAAPFKEFLSGTNGDVTLAYADGKDPLQTCVVFKPEDWTPADRRPAIVLIHGGAWVAGSADIFFPHARYFASRGLVAISLNYRLVTPTGPGLDACVSDCRAALEAVAGHAGELGVDPHKIVVMGDSAGGHLAALLATDPGSVRPAAAILCNPILDMNEGAWVKFVIGGPALDKHAPPEASVPTPSQREMAKSLSPITHVKGGLPPMLLMHGTDDHVVNPEQARAFAAAMTAAGNRCDLQMIPGARHAFIIANYTAPEPLVVESIRNADAFLGSLGLVSGSPTLEPSIPPAWEPKGKK